MPGSFELPVVAKAMAKSGKYDAVVCIGVVVSGGLHRPGWRAEGLAGHAWGWSKAGSESA